MTNEEAKERIQALYNDWLPVEYDFEVYDTEEDKLDREAFVLAIQALEQTDVLDKIYEEINDIDSMTFIGSGSGCASEMKSECLSVINKYREGNVE